jgi:hypothetical protein
MMELLPKVTNNYSFPERRIFLSAEQLWLSLASRLPQDHVHFSIRIAMLYMGEFDTVLDVMVIPGPCKCGRAGLSEICARRWAVNVVKIASAAIFVTTVRLALRFAA